MARPKLLKDQSKSSRREEETELLYRRWLASRYLRKARLSAGVTQKAVTDTLNFDSHTFITAIESSARRKFDKDAPKGGPMLPEDHWETYANLLNIPKRQFCKTMCMYYKPVLFKALFGKPSNKYLRTGVEEE